MMGTRNFRVRSDVEERGSVTKSQKGEKAYVKRKVGECFSVEGTWTMFQRRLMQFHSWHNSLWKQWRRPETKRTIVFSCIPIRRQSRLTERHKNPSCKFRHPPVCQYCKSEKGCIQGDKCHFRHVRQKGSLTKGIDCQWGSAHPRGSTSVRSWSKSVRNRATTQRNACSLVARQALRRPRILLWVGQRSKATIDQRREDYYQQNR